MPDLKDSALRTADALLESARKGLEEAILKKGEAAPLGFEGTAFFLPLAYGVLGCEVASLKDARIVLARARTLAREDGPLKPGLSVLLALEVMAALTQKSIDGYLGFVPDTVLRSLGVQLVDGRIAGIAVLIGAAPSDASAVAIIQEFQSRNIVSLLVGNAGRRNLRDQLAQAQVEMGLDNYIVPLGPDEVSAIYAVNFAVRAALTFGGLKGGQGDEVFSYCQNRVPVFVVVLGRWDDTIAAAGMGALNFGFPVITDQDAPVLGKIATTRYEAIVVEKDPARIARRAWETRGIKTQVTKVPIPVLFGPAFEGERVRKENLKIEFGGKYSPAFEFLTARPLADVEDGRVRLDGEDIDQTDEKALPLGITIEVAGRSFNRDFEPILERQVHRWLNEAQGVMHMGQRDMIWVRVSNDAFQKGLRLKHLGVLLHAMIHKEFGALVDRVQVTLTTDAARVAAGLKEARAVFEARDERLRGMTDEKVDAFYSCALCQSFAPNHICIITPERLGLCGAYSWLDAKAAHEIQPTGGNQPVVKGVCRDARLGQWDNVNAFVAEASHRTISEVSMYSMIVSPQSSCGCFECIVALVPEANGVLVVSRDYPGMTPLGMTFTQMASSVGGGVQTPGFIGVGKLYLISPKFISAEGGLGRIVWMPSDLKEALRPRLEARAREVGLPGDFVDRIAVEKDATTLEDLLLFLKKKAHPASGMPALL